MENSVAQSSRATLMVRIIAGSIVAAVSLLACGMAALVTLFFGSAHEWVNNTAPAGFAEVRPTRTAEPTLTPMPTRTALAESAAPAASPTALGASGTALGAAARVAIAAASQTNATPGLAIVSPSPEPAATQTPEPTGTALPATPSPEPAPTETPTPQPSPTGVPTATSLPTATTEPAATRERIRQVTAIAPALNGQRIPRIEDIVVVTANGIDYAIRAYASVPLDNGDHGVALLVSVTGRTGAAIQRPRCSVLLRNDITLSDTKLGLWPQQYARNWTRIQAGRSEVDWMPVFVFDRSYASADLSGVSCLFDDAGKPVRFTIRSPG